ncbi:Protein mak11 [Sorochytrium milnesiophthora]
MYIVAGSYERLLYGYRFDRKTTALEQVFAFGAHVSCVKCASICPKLGGILATGGQDELIKLYSLKTMKSLGDLFMHTGDVTCVEFFAKSHMLSGGEDGKVVIWRTKDWEPLKTLKGHKTAVHAIAIHPSGKLALSVSSDRVLFCWNLLRGIRATKDKLRDSPVSIAFDATGDHYFVHYNQAVDVYHTATTRIHTRLTARSKLHSVVFHGQHLITGSEDGVIRVYRMTLPAAANVDDAADETPIVEPQLVAVFKGHSSRVRAIRVLRSEDAPSSSEDVLVSISTDGTLKVWDLAPALNAGTDAAASPVEIADTLADADTKSRLTCLAVYGGGGAVDSAAIAQDSESEEESEDESEEEKE